MEGTDTDITGVRDKHAVPCQNLFRRVVAKAESRGMKVNSEKAAMLCISDASSYQAEAHIIGGEGGRIASGKTMKILGCLLYTSPSPRD